MGFIISGTIYQKINGCIQGAVQPPATGVPDISTELLPLLTGGVLANEAGKGGTISSNTMNPLISAVLSSFLSSHRPYVNTRPKAFLNWMVMDEEFYADTSPNHLGAVQIPACNAGESLKQMTGPVNLVIRRNGWIYIYLSNESAQDVFFDNLVVNHKRGPLLEQNDYYSYGMLIPGLSTSAYKYQYNPNRYQYNGIEHDTAFGLDEYEAHYRDLDPVIGRWTTIDPDIENGMEDQSPYSSMNSNPISKSDPSGNDPDGEDGCCDFLIPSSFLDGSAVQGENRLNQALNTTSRQLEVAKAGAESGALNTMTLGATPRTPFMPSSYTDAELSQYNTAFTAGQISASFIETPAVPSNPEFSLAPVNSTTPITLGFNPALPALPVSRAESRGNSNSSEANSNNSNKSKVQKKTNEESIGNGKFTKTTEVRPSKESPGQSRAEMVKYSNKSGKTIKVYKDLYDRGNKFQHRKHKFPGVSTSR